MTGLDYPLLTVPGYDLYQLAQLATFVADALARHRRATESGARRAQPFPAQPGYANADRTGDGFAAAAAALTPPRSATPRPAARVKPPAPALSAPASQSSVGQRQHPERRG